MNEINSNESFQEYGTGRSTNGKFTTGNRGRKKGSKNKAPNLETLNELLNLITSDLVQNYPRLTMNQKIRILHSFAKKYDDNTTPISYDGFTFEFGN